MALTYAGLSMYDCYGCWHSAILPHHLLYCQCSLEVLWVGHACQATAGQHRVCWLVLSPVLLSPE